MSTSKLLQQVLLAFCLLPTAFCFVTFAQGGTGKLPPPRRNPPPPPIKRPTQRPLPPPRESTEPIVASGEVRPIRYVRLTSDVAGRIKQIHVDPGQEVTKGQALVLIETQSSSGSKEETQYSPINGIVVDISSRVGEVASTSLTGPPLMTVADMSTINVEIVVDDSEVSRIVVGQSAKVVVDAFHENELRGVVTAKKLLNVAPDPAARVPATRDFKVTIELREIPVRTRSLLRPGMSATATITVTKNNH